MKILKLFFIGAFVLSLHACEEADDSFQTQAEINVDIPLTAVYLDDADQLKASSTVQYQFNGTAAFCLANKEGLSKCPGSVVGIVPGTGAELTFEALEGFEEIHSLMLEWGYTTNNLSDFSMQEPVQLLAGDETLTKVKFSLDVDEFLAPLISKMNSSPGTYVVIGLSGTANFDANITARVSAPVTVESVVASPRFTL